MSLKPRTLLEGAQRDLRSSDMAFWDDFGLQIGGRAHAERAQNGRAMGFRANSDFVQPSDDFCRF